MSRVSPSQSYAAARTYCRSPEVSPLHQYSWRLRLQNHVRPVSSVLRSESWFIHASISTCPVACSCTIAGTRPSALKVTLASSASPNGIGVTTGIPEGYLEVQPALTVISVGGNGVNVAL